MVMDTTPCVNLLQYTIIVMNWTQLSEYRQTTFTRHEFIYQMLNMETSKYHQMLNMEASEFWAYYIPCFYTSKQIGEFQNAILVYLIASRAAYYYHYM